MSEVAEIPDYLSPEWDAYAMSHFAPSELVDGYPNAAGLRRVAELLLGDIIKSGPTQVFPSEGNGPTRATVVYTVVFEWGRGPNRGTREYSEVADVWHGNTDALFCGYAVATASTRAEGRALRKALKLKKCSAEELSKNDVAKIVAEETVEKISNEQISFIDSKCKKLDINVVAFINSGEKQYRSIYDVTRDTAAKMIKKLSELTNDKSKIDESIKVYTDWR
jgi:hypothetical protein